MQILENLVKICFYDEVSKEVLMAAILILYDIMVRVEGDAALKQDGNNNMK